MAEIKEVLYFHYGKDSFLIGGSGASYPSGEKGAISFVLSTLAEKVLEQVKIEAGIIHQPDPEKSEPQAKVALDTYFAEDEEDYFGERKVAGFDDFTMLKEKKTVKK